MTVATGSRPRGRRAGADRTFRGISLVASATVLLVVAAMAAFLVFRAIPALRADTVNFFTEQVWQPDSTSPRFGIAAALYFTVLTSCIAMALAVPVALT